MTTLRELKGLRIKDAIGKELTVQRAVWNWALYDDYVKTREVARKHRAHLSYYKKSFHTSRVRLRLHPRCIVINCRSKFVPFAQKLPVQAGISKKVFLLLRKNSIILS